MPSALETLKTDLSEEVVRLVHKKIRELFEEKMGSSVEKSSRTDQERNLRIAVDALLEISRLRDQPGKPVRWRGYTSVEIAERALASMGVEEGQ